MAGNWSHDRKSQVQRSNYYTSEQPVRKPGVLRNGSTKCLCRRHVSSLGQYRRLARPSSSDQKKRNIRTKWSTDVTVNLYIELVRNKYSAQISCDANQNIAVYVANLYLNSTTNVSDSSLLGFVHFIKIVMIIILITSSSAMAESLCRSLILFRLTSSVIRKIMPKIWFLGHPMGY